MKAIKNFFKMLWGAVIFLTEKADLIPLLVVVSVVHYAGALSLKDPPAVAISLGILIDLGHYRIVKSYLAKTEFKRLALLVLWTVLTAYFHWRWYQDPILSASIPVLIIFLALLSRWERWSAQAPSLTATSPAVRVSSKPPASELPANSSESQPAGKSLPAPASELSAEPSGLVCAECGATANKRGEPFLSKSALAGHLRSHAKKQAAVLKM